MNAGIKNVLQQIKLFFNLYLILLCACLIVKICFTREQIYFSVNGHYSRWADFVFPFVTDVGNGWTIIIASVLLVLINYRYAFLLATTYTITSLLAQIVKFIFVAPRPHLYFKSQISTMHFVKGVEILNYNSFPSGHTVSAFAGAVLITYLAKRKGWGILLLLVAVSVGFSRMYLSEHFFEDVVAGSSLGVFITIFWISYIDSKKFLQSPNWNRGLLKPHKKSDHN